MLKIYKYRIPFKEPFKSSSNTIDIREGLILEFSSLNLKAYSEIAPLPYYSNESLDEVLTFIRSNRFSIEQALSSKNIIYYVDQINKLHSMPSVTFGLDMLARNVISKMNGISLHNEIFGRKYSKVPCNAVIGISDFDVSMSKARKYLAEGYGTIKIKVSANFEHDIKFIEQLRTKYPKLKIRIDANEIWGVNEAIKNLNLLKEQDLEYCEQPIKSSNLESLKRIRDLTKVNIAADESCRNKSDAFKLIVNDIVDVLIIKPALFGSLEDILVTTAFAKSHEVQVVFTTALESSVMRSFISILASGLSLVHYAHGLATGNLFADDVWSGEFIQNGLYNFSENDSGINFKLLTEVI